MTVAKAELWFRSFEPPEDHGPRRATLIERVSYGQRDDLYLVELGPAEPSGSQETVILASRHQGHTIDAPGEWPVHVYVCAPPPELDQQQVLPKGILSIQSWGLLYPSHEMAERRELAPHER